MVLNSLRSYKAKFSKTFGELVLACDDRDYWRKQIFPYYKANRKKDRDKSELDWNKMFQILNNIRGELKEFFPYKTIQIPHAEADDVIAILCKHYHLKDNILIISGDKDLVQLQKFSNVNQYNPIQKKDVKAANPVLFLKEHILKGDRGDGVPNFLSPGNCFVMDIRQTPLSTKKLAEYVLKDYTEFCKTDILKSNYFRNRQLIDLEYIPEDIEQKILEEFASQNKNRSKLFEFFTTRNLKNLIENIQEF